MSTRKRDRANLNRNVHNLKMAGDVFMVAGGVNNSLKLEGTGKERFLLETAECIDENEYYDTFGQL